MKLFVDKEIKRFFFAVTGIWIVFFIGAEGMFWIDCHRLSAWIFLLVLAGAALTDMVSICYFTRQNRKLEQAQAQIRAYLDGDTTARIDCDEEGELYKLFHGINSLAAVLNAHATKEIREKVFLKNTISDISHQLKTPLAALNIYNGLLQEEAEEESQIKEFASLSEQELDRIETLVQNLLKMTRLDAGSIILEKATEQIADMMQDIRLQFAYRAEQEKKTLLLSGNDTDTFFCDRDWILEAVGNLVKNALDHTKEGDRITISWKCMASAVQIVVADNGCGIHPEDLHHIFKRFYRSRFSKDTQGIGLGLPLAKAIVEAHNGTIEVDSEPGRGAVFTLYFLIPTKL
ncbi:HAMP domain-containing histidine kinase [Kineothrix sp. MSJ-39]|uniref:sensor histidine kinase n=1 Tax=Kineothrix sp. MSJ-39 TaxID=2841533 RepID=UPI001C0FDAED|nr:HAMP domain-containing sensor histidine kinase [Kineothrix sp. MSJ-39]MBU5428657.1 HAMP domain-containing histidine kinase [Kineothrix sp. MSJ-39]